MTHEDLIELKADIRNLRWRVLITDNDELPPIAQECVLEAVSYLNLAEIALSKADLWTIHARTTK